MFVNSSDVFVNSKCENKCFNLKMLESSVFHQNVDLRSLLSKFIYVSMMNFLNTYLNIFLVS